MKYAADRLYADPKKAARRILEIANAVEPIQGRIHIEKINKPFLFRDRGSPAERFPLMERWIIGVAIAVAFYIVVRLVLLRYCFPPDSP
jgi:hypothetical protein